MSAVRVDVDYACGCVMFAVAFSHVGGNVVPDVCVNVLVDQGVVVEDTVSLSLCPPLPWHSLGGVVSVVSCTLVPITWSMQWFDSVAVG